MTAFLARLDGLLIKSLTSEGLVSFLIWLADQSIRVEDWVSRQEARWQARADTQRTPISRPPRAVGRHRHRGRVRFWTHRPVAKFDRSDYEWGQALKRWASRTEGQYLSWQ